MDLAGDFSAKTAVAVRPRARRIRTTIRWLIIVVLIAAVAVAGWLYSNRPTNVAGTRVTRGSVADVVYATGFVEPRSPADVSSRVTAPVITVLADEGDRVTRGQPLAILDAQDLRETMAQLRASRINADQDESRALALFQQGWSTRSDRDKAVAGANSARALEAAGRAKLDQYTIRAGISGIVLRRDVEPGDLATAAKTLFQIGDPRQLRVSATVDERDIPLVRTGARVVMSTQAYPGRIFRGSVYEITPGGNPDQRAFRVRIKPDDTIPVGLTLEVNIMVAERQNALLVPSAAVHNDSVWVVANERARRVPVQLGIRGSDSSEVRQGLSGRDCVITDAGSTLKEGEPVRVQGC